MMLVGDNMAPSYVFNCRYDPDKHTHTSGSASCDQIAGNIVSDQVRII